MVGDRKLIHSCNMAFYHGFLRVGDRRGEMVGDSIFIFSKYNNHLNKSSNNLLFERVFVTCSLKHPCRARTSATSGQPADVCWVPRGRLQKSIWDMHEELPPDLEIAFVAGLKAMARRSEDTPVAEACGFGGCHISGLAMRKALEVWQERYGIRINHRVLVLAERVRWKRQFLHSQFEFPFLLEDVSEMSRNKAVNLVLGREELLPRCDGFDGGFTCASRTKLSSKCSENIDCVQHGSAETGIAFSLCDRAIEHNSSEKVSLECVYLGSKGETTEKSDEEWIVERLEVRGLCSWSVTSNASAFSSPVDRVRTYWGAVKLKVKDTGPAATTFFLSLFRAFHLNYRHDACDCITVDTDLRRSEASKVGLPILHGAGLRLSKRPKKDLGWKLEHKELFDEFGLPWPVDITQLGKDYPQIIFDGLSHREVEACIFLHSVFPPPEAPDEKPMLEFIDINPTVTRIIGGCLSPDNLGTTKRSPWVFGKPGTVVGSMKCVVRVTTAADSHLRCLDGIEYFRLIGWEDRDWKPLAVWGSIFEDVFQLTEGLANLAGNAFSAWQWIAFQMAILSTWGNYGNHGQDPDAHHDATHNASDEELDMSGCSSSFGESD